MGIRKTLQGGGAMPWSKESRQSRGYGPEWDRLRAKVLERDKELCQPCARAGRTTMATEVDHITPKAKAARLGWSDARTNHPDNCQAICSPCHKRKTTEETGRTYRPKVAIGLDGWPVEG
jgi:5-methylcytosine-specific restriction protein A